MVISTIEDGNPKIVINEQTKINIIIIISFMSSESSNYSINLFLYVSFITNYIVKIIIIKAYTNVKIFL